MRDDARRRKASAALGCLLAAGGAGRLRRQRRWAPARARLDGAEARPPAARASQRRLRPSARPARGARAGVAKEVADPQEASSYPGAGVGPPRRRRPRRRRPVKRSSPPARPPMPKCARSSQQMQAVERSAKQAQQQQLTPVAGGRVDRRQRHDPDPHGRPGSRPEGDRRRQRDRRLPLRVRRRARVVRRQRLRLLGLGQLRAGGGRPAERAGDLGRTRELGRAGARAATSPCYANAGHTYMYVDGDPVRHRRAQRRLRLALAGRPTDNAGYVVRHWPGL